MHLDLYAYIYVCDVILRLCVYVCVCVTTVSLSGLMAVPPARTHSVCVSKREREKEMDKMHLYPLYIHLYFTQLYPFIFHTRMPIYVSYKCTYLCFTFVYTFIHATLRIYVSHKYTHCCFTQLCTSMLRTSIHIAVSHNYTHSCCTQLYTSTFHTSTHLPVSHNYTRAVCCSVLNCVALCCIVLQCVALCCSVMQCEAKRPLSAAPTSCVAVICGELQ